MNIRKTKRREKDFVHREKKREGTISNVGVGVQFNERAREWGAKESETG